MCILQLKEIVLSHLLQQSIGTKEEATGGPQRCYTEGKGSCVLAEEVKSASCLKSCDSVLVESRQMRLQDAGPICASLTAEPPLCYLLEIF